VLSNYNAKQLSLRERTGQAFASVPPDPRDSAPIGHGNRTWRNEIRDQNYVTVLVSIIVATYTTKFVLSLLLWTHAHTDITGN
jgi:hypothetical protein